MCVLLICNVHKIFTYCELFHGPCYKYVCFCFIFAKTIATDIMCIAIPSKTQVHVMHIRTYMHTGTSSLRTLRYLNFMSGVFVYPEVSSYTCSTKTENT